MNQNNQKALVFAYYLSKFDLLALSELGFKTWNEAYKYSSSIWDIKSAKNILYPDIPNKDIEFEFDLCTIEQESTNTDTTGTYSIQRISTGLTAEEIFIRKHNTGEIGNQGTLVDTRNDGCGYDFREDLINEHHYYEIKGRFNESGGILMTDKEWSVAKEKGNNYHSVLISNVSSPDNESIEVYSDPAGNLRAKLSVRKVIQTSWVISESEL